MPDTIDLALPTVDAPPVRYGVRRVGHINLFVGSFAQSQRFFHDVCGLEQTGVMTSVGAGFFSAGATHHDIGFVEVSAYRKMGAKNASLARQTGSRADLPGFNHFGWELGSERQLVEAYRRAVAIGLEPRITNHGTSYSNYLIDPDGYQHQFYADNVLDWRTQYTGGEVDLHRETNWVPGGREPSDELMVDEHPPIARVEEAPFHPVKATHAVFGVANLDASLDFYRDVVGLDIAFTDDANQAVYLRGTHSVFDVVLTQARNNRELGYHHSAFELDAGDDLDRIVATLGSRGVPAYLDADLPHKRSVTVGDSDGQLYEFFHRRPGAPAGPSGPFDRIAYL